MTPLSVTTSRPRAGRRFEPTHELALVPNAHRACTALPGSHQGLTVVAEMSGPWGIPDMTALVGKPALLTARLASRVPPLLHEVDAAVIAVAHPRAARTPSQFAAALSWPEDTIRRRLTPLIRSGALTETNPGRFVRDEAIQPLGRLYAVEAKVRDWRKALHQVRAYSVWADSYVLVMGALTSAAEAQVFSEVTADRAGLVIDGRWLRRPTVHRLPSSKRLWAAEHLVAAIEG